MTVEQQAADWFARMHGPEADQLRDEFERWRAEPDHAAAYERLAHTWDQAKFLAHTRTGLERDLDLVRKSRRSAFPRIAAGLGVLIAIGCVALLVGASGRLPQIPADPQSASDTDVPETQRIIALSDGSRIILDENARYRNQFSNSERRLTLLSGRARFVVSHDGQRPFIVEAGNGRVIAHGTVFDVSLDHDDVLVALIEGAVEVRSRRAPTVADGAMLIAGQKVTMQGDTLGRPVALDRSDTAWFDGMIEFDAIPLAEAVARFNQTSSTVVVLGAGVDGDQRLSGAFRRDDAENFAASLAGTFGLDLKKAPDGSLALIPGAQSTR